MNWHVMLHLVLLLAVVSSIAGEACSDPCYNPRLNDGCIDDNLVKNDTPVTLHMTVHPHLDAFWIFDFEGYYDPPHSRGDIWGYFSSNRFATVKDIFTTATDTLNKSKAFREKYGEVHEKARRTFVNSEMGFFKRWWDEQNADVKATVKELLKTKYWEVLGGGFVENDQAGAYYDDIIENYQIGAHFLEENFGYIPKVAISADSFGHSQSMAALLVHFGIEGFLVERSDQHILNRNKLEFFWKARSANGKYYGAIPTHIRWSIHGYEEQFVNTGGTLTPICQTKGNHIDRMRNENKFLRRLHQQPHVLRYFGHDFQKFDDYSYNVIEEIMRQFSKEKCNKVVATYTNPTEYFKQLYRGVFEKQYKAAATREEDIFPIWDFDSGLYWTGYFTTDPYHKKIYRDSGRFLQLVRKLFLPQYLKNASSTESVRQYEQIQRLEEQVAYIQHHDGITCTSKYSVLDQYENNVKKLQEQLSRSVVKDAFNEQFPDTANEPVLFTCALDEDCVVPFPPPNSFMLNVFNSGGLRDGHLRVHLPVGVYYSSPNADIETVCFCYQLPCNCTLYIYNKLPTYTSLLFMKQDSAPTKTFTLQALPESGSALRHNNTHLTLVVSNKEYHVSYKKVVAEPTQRSFEHVNAQGGRSIRAPTINSGKYAMGNNPNKIEEWSSVKDVSVITTDRLTVYVVEWGRAGMLTVLTQQRSNLKSWQVDTHSAATGYKLADYFLVVDTPIKNGGTFFTDSNGWLVMRREMFHHDDYEAYFSKEHYDDIDGNTYPITAFAYIEDTNDKVSVNTDRPQGCIGYREGALWINFDRLSSDDGKWVWQSTYRSEYMKFTHHISVQNKDFKERKLQVQYDSPLFVQGRQLSKPAEAPGQPDISLRGQWTTLSKLDSGNLKFSLRAWNDSTLLMRVQNMHDQRQENLTLFASNTSVVLTSFYGSVLAFEKIYETTLQGNQPYEQFVQKKWNWHQVIDLSKENGILDKNFAENITLRPLEIRAFKLIKPRFLEECQVPTDLKYNNYKTNYSLNYFKDFERVDRNPTAEAAIDYLLNQNHCDSINPPKTEWTPLSQLTSKPSQSQPEPQSLPPKLKPFVPKPAQPTQPSKQHEKPVHPSTTSDSAKPQPSSQASHDGSQPQQAAGSQPQQNIPHSPKTPSSPSISKSAAEASTFEHLSLLASRLVMLSPEEKRAYFRHRLEEIRLQPSTC